MKILTPVLLSVTAMAMIVPAASAQSRNQPQTYQGCVEDREGRQVAGAIIGGLLGAVIGNELADDSNNNRHGMQRWERRRGHHGRRAYQHRDRGNAEEVGTIAGAGVGALIGAGVAGGDECDRYRNGAYNGYPDKPSVSEYQDSRYGNSYGNNADYGYQDNYNQGSSVELAGSRYDNGQARTYNATSSSSSFEWNCQWMSMRSQSEFGQTVTDQTYMCEGADGIWRPYEDYTQ